MAEVDGPPIPSVKRATVGRIVHVYEAGGEPGQINGPYAGIVVSETPPTGEPGTWSPTPVNVNVLLDGFRDEAKLSGMRRSREGNTVPSLFVFDSLDGEKRSALVGAKWARWAEWPRQV